MPPTRFGDYLVSMAIGFNKQSHTEIRSWQKGTRTRLTAAEFKTLFKYIGIYQYYIREYSGKDKEAPYVDFMGAKESKTLAQNQADAMHDRFKIMLKAQELKNG